MHFPSAFRAGAIAMLSSAGIFVSASAVMAGPVLVELFTSQGCSSCPPADAFMGDLVGRDDVIAISLPVDYWNYLGWEDTFAKPAHTERQRAYAAVRGDGQVYTPQMVVGGRWHVIGSDRNAVNEAIREAADLPDIGMNIRHDSAGLHVDVDEAVGDDPDWGTVWLVMYKDAETVDIGRGENAGRAVTYHHIVLEMHRLTMWRGDEMTIELPMMELAEVGADGCIVILQQDAAGGLPGPVIGAAVYETP